MIWRAEKQCFQLQHYRGFHQLFGSCWIDTIVYMLIRDSELKNYVMQSMRKHKNSEHQEFIDAFIAYSEGFEQNANEKKGELLRKMHSAIRNLHSIEMDARGYGDFHALIYFICKIVNILTPETPAHDSSSALYELIWSYDGLENTSSEFVTMSIDVLHRGFDPHVIGLYKIDGGIELYDNQSFMYKNVLSSDASYITIRNSDTDKITEILSRLELTSEFQTLKIRKITKTT